MPIQKKPEETVKYEIPKSLNEIGLSCVTIKDFLFDREQPIQVV